MRLRSAVALTAVSIMCLGLTAQTPVSPNYADPVPMPQDREDDSYVIYAQLLKSGPIEWRTVSRKQWLLEATTNAMALDVSCGPVAEHPGMNRRFGGMEPHTAIQAPAERQTEWNEVLADYDRHCHDVIQLDVADLKTEIPVRLLNEDEKRLYRQNSEKPMDEFAEGAGLHRFTEVYFNAHHTLALVEQGMWCGMLCGNWTWVALEKKNGQWKMLPWSHMTMMS